MAQLSYINPYLIFFLHATRGGIGRLGNWKEQPDVCRAPHSFHLDTLWFEKTIWSLWLTTVSTQYMYNVLRGETWFPSEKWICAARPPTVLRVAGLFRWKCAGRWTEGNVWDSVCVWSCVVCVGKNREKLDFVFLLIILTFFTQHLFLSFSVLSSVGPVRYNSSHARLSI